MQQLDYTGCSTQANDAGCACAALDAAAGLQSDRSHRTSKILCMKQTDFVVRASRFDDVLSVSAGTVDTALYSHTKRLPPHRLTLPEARRQRTAAARARP